jgi:hypothetical protein
MFFFEPFELALVEQLTRVLGGLTVCVFWVVEAHLAVDSFPVFPEIVSSFVGGLVADVRFEDPRLEDRNSRVDATDLVIQGKMLNQMALDILFVALLGSSNDFDLVERNSSANVFRRSNIAVLLPIFKDGNNRSH